MDNPLVSIIIPVYNREDLLAETLESVVNQTYDNWECVLVDDGSTDDTLDIAWKYQLKDSRFKAIKRNRPPKGAPTCRNIGANKATGDFLIFLDSDDLLLSNCLESRISFISKSELLDFYVFPVSIEKDPFNPKFNKIWLDRGNTFNDDLTAFLLWSQWQTMSVVWRRHSFFRIGGFDEKLLASQDGDLHRRALIHEFKYVKSSQAPDSIYRINPESLSFRLNDGKWHSKFITFCRDYIQLKERGKLTPLRKNIIIGQMLHIGHNLKTISGFQSFQEVKRFLILNRLINKFVFFFIEKYILGKKQMFFQFLIKRIFSLIYSKYYFWKI